MLEAPKGIDEVIDDGSAMTAGSAACPCHLCPYSFSENYMKSFSQAHAVTDWWR